MVKYFETFVQFDIILRRETHILLTFKTKKQRKWLINHFNKSNNKTITKEALQKP